MGLPVGIIFTLCNNNASRRPAAGVVRVIVIAAFTDQNKLKTSAEIGCGDLFHL